jgi:hypothetical protein
MALLVGICTSVDKIYEWLNHAIQSPQGQDLLGIIYHVSTSRFLSLYNEATKEANKKKVKSESLQKFVSELMQRYFKVVIVLEELAKHWDKLGPALQSTKAAHAQALARSLGADLNDKMARLDGETLRQAVSAAIFHTELLATVRAHVPQAICRQLKI